MEKSLEHCCFSGSFQPKKLRSIEIVLVQPSIKILRTNLTKFCCIFRKIFSLLTFIVIKIYAFTLNFVAFLWILKGEQKSYTHSIISIATMSRLYSIWQLWQMFWRLEIWVVFNILVFKVRSSCSLPENLALNEFFFRWTIQNQ
jgi:hypothetical protein